VVRADGTVMHALAVIYVLRAVDGVGEFKIIQHDLDRIEVLVVPDARGRRLRQGDRAWLAASPRLGRAHPDAHRGQHLAGGLGKHRYVVSRAKSPAVDELRRSEPLAGAAKAPLH